MDYPYIEVQARVAEGGRPTVALQYEPGDSSITEADVIGVVRELLATTPGLVEVTAVRHHIAETAV
ncbi:hypothetical protein ACIBCS_27745 [Streptomyces phaeochromogenes]|uniref:hypothetical protein n=1 Tax=Streptomyces phaeochromogenes TaxID=1923 RepID=UPI0033E25740